MKRMLLAAVALALTSSFNVFAQEIKNETPSEEKSEARLKLESDALKLLGEALDQTPNLRLWENRAIVYGVGGDILWESDRKQARKLFGIAAEELQLGTNPKKLVSSDYMDAFYAREKFSPRRLVLMMIAGRDADLALKLLLQTRPTNLQAALDRKDIEKPKGVERSQIEVDQDQKDSRAVGAELRLEQTIARIAADQNPAKAAELIRKSLKSGVTNSAVELLAKVQKTDEKLAGELMSEVITKLLDADYSTPQAQESWVAQNILSRANKQSKQKKPEDKDIPMPTDFDLESLANKVADAIIGRKNLNFFWNFSEMMPILEKYAPSKTSALRAKKRELEERGPAYLKSFNKSNALIKDESKSPEDLVAAARTFTRWQKDQLYNAAISKAKKAGTLERLRSALKAESTNPQRDTALSKLDSMISALAIEKGDTESVRDLIDSSETAKAKLNLMVDLAKGLEAKNDEDSHKLAVELMKDAELMVNRYPEDGEEANNMLTIASGFAYVDPESAFEYLDGLKPMVNDLVMANSLISKYNKRSSKFIEGEAILTQHIPATYSKYGKDLGKLAAYDIDRTRSLIDGIKREEIKMLLKLLVVQSVFKEKIGFEGNRVQSVSIISTE